MSNTHTILADVSAGISELKKNPMSIIAQGIDWFTRFVILIRKG